VTDRLLTAAELGELLGFAAGTIVDWAERGTIPAFKLGGRLRFREGEVLDWLEAQRLTRGRTPEERCQPTPSSVRPRSILGVSASPTEGGA
jgi:excisionase family DNA binding protein